MSVGLTRSPLMSMFTDMANVSASGRINKHSCLLAAAGYSCINFEIRGRGPNFSNTSDIEMSVYLSDTGISIAMIISISMIMIIAIFHDLSFLGGLSISEEHAWPFGPALPPLRAEHGRGLEPDVETTPVIGIGIGSIEPTQ